MKRLWLLDGYSKHREGCGVSRNPPVDWSGRPDSNRRRPAWEAGILPLNYGRPAPPILRRSRAAAKREPGGRGTAACVHHDRRNPSSICVGARRTPPYPGHRSRLLAVLDRHLRRLDPLVAARFPGDPLARAVEVDLLVERRRGGVIDPELVDLVIEGQPLLLVHLLLRRVEQTIEIGVGVCAEIAAGAEQRTVH